MCADRVAFDVVIVGSGIAGALIAKRLGLAGKKVLVLEAGEKIPPNINDYMNRFYGAPIKVPESPYPPDINADPTLINAGRPTSLTLGKDSWQDSKQAYMIQKGPLAFASTYERIGGGTVRHWLGTSLRFVPNDFRMQSKYGGGPDWPAGLVDWPIGYSDLELWYGDAEHEIGVSANVEDQAYLGITFPPDYKYPMPRIPPSTVDKAIESIIAKVSVGGKPLSVSNTPAARNSQPYQSRRVCAGNTNCIPICPIQAKYDPSVTLNDATNTNNVTIWYRTVATEVIVGENGLVSEIKYRQYDSDREDPREPQSVSAKIFVIAAHAIETPRLLLMSRNERTPFGVANSWDKNKPGKLGCYLMDHPYYVPWGLLPETATPVWPYRGPLSTSGIESARDGEFRSKQAAFRVDIGNEGWNFVVGGMGGDPGVTTADFINGTNVSGTNDRGPGGKPEVLFGRDLVKRLNGILTRQVRLGFLVEQTPDESNRVTVPDPASVKPAECDHLGLPRPHIRYDLSDYTKRGLAAAKVAGDQILQALGAKQLTAEVKQEDGNPTAFEWPNGSGNFIRYYGAGHIVGTYRMGSDRTKSVVDSELRSWDHKNLYLAGSGVFPTVATANPTLTLAALSLRLAETIKQALA